MVTIKSFDGGEFDAYLARPAGGYGPGIVVLQEIFGVNDVVRGVADWYAAHGFVALAPDLFWRIQRGVELTDRGDDWKRAIDFYQKLDEAKSVEDSAAALEFLRKHPAERMHIINLLIGDVFREGVDSVYGPMSEFAEIPPPLYEQLDPTERAEVNELLLMAKYQSYDDRPVNVDTDLEQ